MIFISPNPFGLKSRSNIHSVDAAKESYTGKEQDVESNLYYFGARYYDPAAARWLSVDPVANQRPSLNSYHYVQNNPINRIDPDGKFDGVSILLGVLEFCGEHPTAAKGISETIEIEAGAGDMVGIEAEALGVTINISAEAGVSVTLSGKEGITSSISAKGVAKIASKSENGPKVGGEAGIELKDDELKPIKEFSGGAGGIEANSDLKIGGTAKIGIGKLGLKVNLTEVDDAVKKV